VIFIIPFLERFSLIGTTDLPYFGDPAEAACTPGERHKGGGGLMDRRLALVGLATVAACGNFAPTAIPIEPGVLAVNTAPGATLEVLDWGGTGPTLVFLAGGGHTAHEFDEFAPRLTDSLRVIGITRRGVGASSSSRHGVARDAITDIARVLDALELGSVVLVGHSQGGIEAAHFAQLYPDRCAWV